MKVSELIEKLKGMPQDFEVWSYDSDYEALWAPVIESTVTVWNEMPEKVFIRGDIFSR